MDLKEPERTVNDRRSEWFAPKFGPLRFRAFVGLLFLPYTGMVISYAIMGSLLVRSVHWERVLWIAVIYFLGLGIAAHALDALGSKGTKPWGRTFTRRQLVLAALFSLVTAYVIAVYYMIYHVPWLSIVAVLEGFFVFAYNLEWFSGRFHRDGWFAFSWGFLPVLAGYLMQSNGVSAAAIAVGFAMALFSLVEIKASRPYKELKHRGNLLQESEKELLRRYETILKSISMGVLFLCSGLLVFRMTSH
jgi:hypothetical protein